MSPAIVAAAAFIGGYLLGSIPFGLLFARLAGAGDVRKIGSGNIGATNVLRTGSKWAAAATLICDAGKGAIAILIARHYGDHWAAAAAGMGAFAGHVFPVWLQFKGGKGVATFLGIALALAWQAGLCACATWLIAAAITRRSSVGALAAAAMTPIYMLLWHHAIFMGVTALLALVIFWTHRENIARLIAGAEPRIGAGK